jgi:hypothetical protein
MKRSGDILSETIKDPRFQFQVLLRMILFSYSGIVRKTLAFWRLLWSDLLRTKGSRCRGFQDSRVYKKKFFLDHMIP